jgi:hypothetical protein
MLNEAEGAPVVYAVQDYMFVIAEKTSTHKQIKTRIDFFIIAMSTGDK